MVRWGDPQAECQMSTINKHYCPVSADIKHTSSILPASYTSPASPWLISDFNLFGRPLREGSLLFIYIVRFIYRDGETRSEEERRSLSAHLSARTGSLRGPAGSVSPRLLIPRLGLPQSHILGFQIFCTQSTINNGWTEDQDCKIHRKIQLVATLRSGSLPADDGGRGEVIRHQAPGGIINCLPSWLSYSCPRVTTPDWARREGGIGVLSDG